MKRPPLLDPALLVSALVLGSYLALTAESPTTAEFELRTENILPAFSAESIVALRFVVPDSFVLSRNAESQDPTQYVIETAGQKPADEEAVRSLLRLLDLASFKRTLGDGAHLEGTRLGFDSPRLEMRVDAGPRSYRIVAGSAAPSPLHSVYLKVEGTNVETKIGVVDESVVAQLTKTEQEFLGGLVFPLARSETRSLKLTSDKGAVHLIPNEHSFFLQSSSGNRIEADREFVDLVFFQLARTKLETYLDAPPHEPMPVRIQQQAADGTEYVAELGAPCPGDPDSILVYRIKPEKLSGCASRTVLSAFNVEETRLRSLTATSMSPDEIDHVIIRSDQSTLDVLREGRGYKLLSRDGKAISEEAGNEFLKGLARAKLVPVAEPPQGLKATGEVMIKGQIRNTALSNDNDRTDHPVEVRLETYKDSEDHLYIRRESDASWLAVSETQKWLFLPDDAWARERKLGSFGLTQVERVRVTLPGGTSWQVERDEDKLILTGSTRAADPSLTRELFQTLADLSALRYVTPAQPRPETGLLHLNFDVKTQPLVNEKLSVNKPAAVKTWNLWIGRRVRGGYLAWSDLTEGTFVLPSGSRLPLETPLEDRRAFRVNLEELTRLAIETDGREVVFERHADVWRSVGGEASDEMIEPLADAFDAVRVVSAVGKHPEAMHIRRGTPEVTIHTTEKLESGGAGKSSTLHLGAPTVWQGISCRTGWIEGEPETYFVEEASLAVLRELL